MTLKQDIHEFGKKKTKHQGAMYLDLSEEAVGCCLCETAQKRRGVRDLESMVMFCRAIVVCFGAIMVLLDR